MSEGVEALTDATFDAAVGGSTEPYLVEFSSEWCAPCAAMRSVLEEIAAERAGKLRVGVVDILEQPEAAERFEIKSTPTLIVFRGGEPVKRIHGARGKRQLVEELRELVGQ